MLGSGTRFQGPARCSFLTACHEPVLLLIASNILNIYQGDLLNMTARTGEYLSVTCSALMQYRWATAHLHVELELGVQESTHFQRLEHTFINSWSLLLIASSSGRMSFSKSNELVERKAPAESDRLHEHLCQGCAAVGPLREHIENAGSPENVCGYKGSR
jgi:hypothetical protein